MRIKICGLTHVDDALAAIDAGADALGFAFTPHSRREITPSAAAEIVRALPPFVAVVGLFVDPTPAWVTAVLREVPLTLLQFQGDETAEQCALAGVPYVKAVRVDGPVDPAAVARRYPSACAVQLDSAVAGQAGGTGVTFDWRWFPKRGAKPWILAGGLNETNVASAVRAVSPYAVDVSSGVENAPGVKNHARMRAFCAAVRDA